MIWGTLILRNTHVLFMTFHDHSRDSGEIPWLHHSLVFLDHDLLCPSPFGEFCWQGSQLHDLLRYNDSGLGSSAFRTLIRPRGPVIRQYEMINVQYQQISNTVLRCFLSVCMWHMWVWTSAAVCCRSLRLAEKRAAKRACQNLITGVHRSLGGLCELTVHRALFPFIKWRLKHTETLRRIALKSRVPETKHHKTSYIVVLYSWCLSMFVQGWRLAYPAYPQNLWRL